MVRLRLSLVKKAWTRGTLSCSSFQVCNYIFYSIMSFNLSSLTQLCTPYLFFSLPNIENNLISMQVEEQPLTIDGSFVGILAFLVPTVISCLFLIPQLTFYHLAAFYELTFLVICIDLLVCAQLTGILVGPLFVLFIISLTTLESVILLSYLVYRSTKTSIEALRDAI